MLPLQHEGMGPHPQLALGEGPGRHHVVHAVMKEGRLSANQMKDVRESHHVMGDPWQWKEDLMELNQRSESHEQEV